MAGFPACLLAGGGGDVGEKGEGTECYLLVPQIGFGAACGGGAMERGGRGGSVSPAVARRRGLAGAAGCGGFGRRWGSCWGGLFGRERAEARLHVRQAAGGANGGHGGGGQRRRRSGGLGAAVGWSGRTSEPRGTRSRGQLGSREGGGGGSALS